MKLHPSNYYSNTSLSEFQLLADESCSPPKEQARVDSGSQLSWRTRREDFSANLLGNFSHRIESKTALFDIFVWGFVCGFAKKKKHWGDESTVSVQWSDESHWSHYLLRNIWWLGAQELIQMHTYLMSIDVQNVQVLGRR